MDRIDALRLFVRLAERGSFSAAARDLKIKQPTASKWVAELEAQLGVRLVDRTTRSLHLTDAGRRFLARSTGILAAFDEAARELSDEGAEPAGRVRISLPVVFGRLFVLPPLTTFLRAHPGVSAELVFDDRYVNLVDEGFDLAIRVGVPTDTSARGRKIADGRRRVVASRAYVKAHGRPRAPKELRDHECLLHGAGGAAVIWRFGHDRGPGVPVAVRGRVAASSSEAVLHLARAGLGVALLADWLVAEDLEKKRLVSLLDDFEAAPAPVYVLAPQGPYPTPLVRALTEHLAAALASSLSRA
jgi:DNA-binding transcriptional LysR family regulator